MVPILLFLILLVIAWPIFAMMGGTLFILIGAHLPVVIGTVAFAVIYILVLSSYGKRYNLKLGGKYGEALDPTKPAGVRIDRDQVTEDFLAAKMAESLNPVAKKD